MFSKPLFQSVGVIALTVATFSAQAVTLEYDPGASSDYAIADIDLSLEAFGSTNSVTGNYAELTDGDLSTGISFGRFLNPGLLDVGVELNTPASTDRFRLTAFSVVVGIGGVPLDPASPQLLFTDEAGTPQNLATTVSNLPNSQYKIEAVIVPSGFLLDPGATITLSGIDLPFTEPEALIWEVIVEGSAEPVPEPTSLALLGLGGLLVTPRRRR